MRGAYLFGSSAKAERLNVSDVDLIIISDDFSDMGWLDRCEALQKIWDAPYLLDVLPFTREEWEDRVKNSLIMREIDFEKKELRLT